jgi:hypothetical protein
MLLLLWSVLLLRVGPLEGDDASPSIVLRRMLPVHIRRLVVDVTWDGFAGKHAADVGMLLAGSVSDIFYRRICKLCKDSDFAFRTKTGNSREYSTTKLLTNDFFREYKFVTHN